MDTNINVHVTNYTVKGLSADLYVVSNGLGALIAYVDYLKYTHKYYNEER